MATVAAGAGAVLLVGATAGVGVVGNTSGPLLPQPARPATVISNSAAASARRMAKSSKAVGQYSQRDALIRWPTSVRKIER
jgi:hypothetical protein